jgi:hypothetical protein
MLWLKSYDEGVNPEAEIPDISEQLPHLKLVVATVFLDFLPETKQFFPTFSRMSLKARWIKRL